MSGCDAESARDTQPQRNDGELSTGAQTPEMSGHDVESASDAQPQRNGNASLVLRGVPSTSKARMNENSLTSQLFRDFQLLEMNIPWEQFVGICAYLKALLEWGLDIPPSAYDDFILDYTDFDHPDTEVEEPHRLREPRHATLAYHEWFVQHRLRTHIPGSILTDEKLRLICAENPYTCYFTEQRMELITDMVSRQQDEGP